MRAGLVFRGWFRPTKEGETAVPLSTQSHTGWAFLTCRTQGRIELFLKEVPLTVNC